MSGRKRLKPVNDVFIGTGGKIPVQTEFQFEFHDDTEVHGGWFKKNRLFRYITAGGLSQTRRTTADDLAEYRVKRFWLILLFLSLVWIVFYFLPCN
ncbi:MAG: hypothetical protein J5985_09205 [Kiritimatiellae bacterium]|nr:hypothetical protein [Kiritimatiellia bacterium]